MNKNCHHSRFHWARSTFDLDLWPWPWMSGKLWSSGPIYMCKKSIGSKERDWKRTDGADCIAFRANVVGKIQLMFMSSFCHHFQRVQACVFDELTPCRTGTPVMHAYHDAFTFPSAVFVNMPHRLQLKMYQALFREISFYRKLRWSTIDVSRFSES